jgi:putative hydrolase of the HAD superfamily
VAAGLSLDWSSIDTVLLDMDGTLLDLNFDNHFWQVHLPQRYAAARGVSLEVGREELMARYHARAGTLDWYSVDFWETALELDIMQLKQEVAHLIDIHPHVTDFLAAVRRARSRGSLTSGAGSCANAPRPRAARFPPAPAPRRWRRLTCSSTMSGARLSSG